MGNIKDSKMPMTEEQMKRRKMTEGQIKREKKAQQIMAEVYKDARTLPARKKTSTTPRITAESEAKRKATLKRGPVKRPKKKPTSFRDMKF